LFLDRLSVHMMASIQTRLAQIGIVPVYFPAKTAPDLSPLDNFFFHLFKNNFRPRDKSSPEAKKNSALEAYDAVANSSILACWKRCGLLTDTHVEEIDLTEEPEDVVVVVDPNCN